ncbi:ovochymase [Eucyclogobius newberryi]|uniref:ovochymase n=1 Tax=Eucyclogobius newberryi TaxID=166745 RepID=UPI003B5B385B
MWRLSLLVVLLCPWASSKLLGWVESPGYPNGYPPHSSLNWSRCAPKGHALSIQLIHLDLEDSHLCENDAVKVFSNGHLISVLCGGRSYEELQSGVNPQLWSGSGGCLVLSFHSDFSNRHRHSGFRGFYTVQDIDECQDPDNGCTQFCHNFIGGYYCSCRHGYHLDADSHTCTVSCSEDLAGQTEGRASSPSWPGLYPENSRCVHTLSVEPHLQLQLTFTAPFDLEQGPEGECVDSLRIETHSGSLGPFCGSAVPPSPLLTHSHRVKIHFESDSYGTNRGFSLSFTTADKVCLSPISPHSSLTPHSAEYSPGQTVTVTCDPGHFVNVGERKVSVEKEYVKTCQRTGDWKPLYTCQPLNCGRPEIPRDAILAVAGPDKPRTLYGSQIRFNCSSPYYRLQGDDTYTCGVGGEWISPGNDTQLPKCIEVCGMPQESSFSAARILGGKNAELGQIPWYLLIKEPRRGGASLISDRWAVTAAHVVEDYEDARLTWFGGIVDGQSPNNVELISEKIIIHPDYAQGLSPRTTFDNDIALVRFASRVELGPRLSPICLPENNDVLAAGYLGTIAGFGVRETSGKGQVARRLKHVSIGVFSDEKCQKTPQNMQYTQNMFCAGADGKDSCEKDSGGPFFVPSLGESRRPHRLMGIVSWGAACHQTEHKGYYTKVKNYVPWILETIAATENSLKFASFWIFQFHLKTSGPVQTTKVHMFNLDMSWTFCVIWLLCVSVSECLPLTEPEPVLFGAVQSPLYPSPYPPNLLQRWELNVPEGHRISLTFTHLDLEPSADCIYDSVTVLYKKKVLGRFCGQENSADGHHPGSGPILSPGNSLTLLMQTDDDNPERHQNVGFSAHYQAIDMDECSDPELNAEAPVCSQICHNTLGSYLCSCHHGYELHPDQRTCLLSCLGGIFDEPEGHLSSPGYPNAPPHEVSCQYIVSVEPGFKITLNFSDHFHIESLETEKGLSCPHHWLQLTVENENPMKLCGNKSPGVMALNTSTVKLDYYNDDKGLSNGWSLDYTTERVKCAPPGTVPRGRVTPTLDEYFYRDYIFVRCQAGYKLMMNGQEIESFYAMCHSNGQWHLPLPECHIIDCGEPEPLLHGGVSFLSGERNEYNSVVQYHCNQPFYSLHEAVNVSFSCEADRKWRAVDDFGLKPICIPVCGKPQVRFSNFQRIVGGSMAPEGSIPWQVRLVSPQADGGGMLISDRWVLTAAHVLCPGICPVNTPPTPHNMLKIFWGTNTVVLVPNSFAASLHLHPGYNNPDKLHFDNDIALIKLPEPITFNTYVMPICLPPVEHNIGVGETGLVSGFGLKLNEHKGLSQSNNLEYVRLPVVNPETCSKSLEDLKSKYPQIPVESLNMFCAGHADGSRDACQGDSGGPFALWRTDHYWAAGIVSWGVQCGMENSYGFYTRVQNYVEWIHKTMNEN